MIGKDSQRRYRFILLILGFLLLLFYFGSIVPTLYVQDEAATYFSSKSLVEGNSFYIENGLNNLYGTNIFHPGYSSYDVDDNIQFNTPKTISLVYSILYLIFGEYIIYSTLIFVFFTLIVIYLFSRKIYSSKYISLFSIFLISFMPLLLAYATSLFTIIPAVFFILLILYLILYFRIEDYKNMVIISILINFLIYIRFSEAIILLPLIILIVFFRIQDSNKFKNISRLIGGILLFFMIFQAPFIAVTGDSFSSSYFTNKRDYTSLNESINKESFTSLYQHNIIERMIAYPLGTEVGIKDFSFSNYIEKIGKNLSQFQFVGPYPFFYISILGLFVYLLSKKKSNKFVCLVFLVFFILLLFYGPRINYYGFGQENIRSSIYRYFLVFYILIALFIGEIIKKLKGVVNFKVFVFSLFLFVSIYILISFSYMDSPDYNGVFYSNGLKYNQKETLDYINNLDEKSVIMVGYNTDRYTYVLDSNLSYTRTINYHIDPYYYNTKLEESLFFEIRRVTSELLDDQYLVYFIYTPYDRASQGRYMEFLEEEFYMVELETFDSPENIKIMELSKK